MSSRTHLVHATCDQACRFCAQAGLPLSSEEFSGEACVVWLVGGEPTLAPGLESTVRQHAEAGRRIVLQTNAAQLDEKRLAALKSAGLSALHLSIHGPAEVHDFLTQTPGSHERHLAALESSQKLGLEAAVTSVISRPSYRSLHTLPSLLKSRGVACWRLQVPQIAGRLRTHFLRIYPRLALAMPHALHALDQAKKRNLPAQIINAPLCLVGPFSADAITTSDAGAFAEACSGCAARPQCAGLDAKYLARFHGDELRPRNAASTVVAIRPDLFAGIGPALIGDTTT